MNASVLSWLQPAHVHKTAAAFSMEDTHLHLHASTSSKQLYLDN
jgi:hypothetical protein